MEHFTYFVGFIAICFGGWELSKAGNERNWVRYAEAMTVIIFGYLLITSK